MMAQDQTGIDYGPADTGQLTDDMRRKLDLFHTKLLKYRDTLPPSASVRSKMTDSKLKDLAMSLLDETIFSIVQELEDIQSLSERDLLNKRMKVVGQHKTLKLEMNKRHKEEVFLCQHRPHHLPLVKTKHEKEKDELEERLSEEVRSLDQEIILELDQIVSDQQSTLFQAAVPFFAVTNNAQDIQVQMHILKFMLNLSRLTDTI